MEQNCQRFVEGKAARAEPLQLLECCSLLCFGSAPVAARSAARPMRARAAGNSTAAPSTHVRSYLFLLVRRGNSSIRGRSRARAALCASALSRGMRTFSAHRELALVVLQLTSERALAHRQMEPFDLLA